MQFEKFGGFDALYLKMLACGIPTSVHLMWIPISELSLQQQFLLVTRVVSRAFNALRKTQVVSNAKDTVLERIKNVNDDIMMAVVFPVIEFIIPYQVLLHSLWISSSGFPEYIYNFWPFSVTVKATSGNGLAGRNRSVCWLNMVLTMAIWGRNELQIPQFRRFSVVPLVSNSKLRVWVCCVSCFPLSEKKGSKTSWLWTLPSRSKRAEILESGMQLSFFTYVSLSSAPNFQWAVVLHRSCLLIIHVTYSYSL